MMSYIKVFRDISGTVDMLSDVEAGRLFKALLHYGSGAEDELPGQEKLVFSMLKAQIDRDEKEYREFCEKQRANGQKGGRPKKPRVIDENPENPVVFTETQKSQEEEEEINKDSLRVAREIPTVSEVEEYARSVGLDVDAERFIRLHEINGWCDSHGQPIRDWRLWLRGYAERYSTPKRQEEIIPGPFF